MVSCCGRGCRVVCHALAFVSLAFVVIGLASLTILMDDIVEELIAKNLPLKNDSKSFKLWTKPPATPYLKIYLFNVTNGEQHLRDSANVKLAVEEFGPYVYSETWEKVDVVWNPNGTISYKQNKVYRFERDLSAGLSEDDEYTLPNVPMISAIGSTKYTPKSTRRTVAKMLEMMDAQPFIQKSVREWLWGYGDTLLALGKMVDPEMSPYDQFGFWYGRNNTGDADKTFTVRSGVEQLADFAKIELWNGETELSFWNGKPCNEIGGTDGSAFPSFLQESSLLQVFNPDLCQTLKLIHTSTLKHDEEEDIKLFRFTPANSTFGDAATYPENVCFCPDELHCSKSGTFNLSMCQRNAPVFVSWPHFLQGDGSLLEAIDGMRPNESLHQFYIDIEPTLGVPMRAKARFQINIFLGKVDEIEQSANFTDILVPMIWFEDGLDSLPEEIMDIVRDAVVLPDTIKSASLYGAIGLGTLLAAGVTVYALWAWKKRNSEPKERQESLEFDNLGHTGTAGE